MTYGPVLLLVPLVGCGGCAAWEYRREKRRRHGRLFPFFPLLRTCVQKGPSHAVRSFLQAPPPPPTQERPSHPSSRPPPPRLGAISSSPSSKARPATVPSPRCFVVCSSIDDSLGKTKMSVRSTPSPGCIHW
ncbi:hypothetical protein VPH35_051633 [Triticum aestivum]